MDRFLLLDNSEPLPAVTAAYGAVEVDWLEDDDAHIFKFNLPGLRANDVKVQMVSESTLQVSGTRPAVERPYGKWHAKERPSGSFRRTFQLPGEVRSNEVKAYDVDGILVVKVPKKKPLVRNIPIAIF